MSESTTTPAVPTPASPEREKLTARDYFARKFPGGGKRDAHYACKIGDTSLREYVNGHRDLSPANARALQEWSMTLAHPAVIDAALTLGITPT